MKKTTFLKVILLTFMFLQSFLSFSQNELAYVFSPDKDNLSDSSKSGIDVLWDNSELDNTVKKSGVTVSPSDNPVIRYAQLPFAGQVAICPDNNKELPKLFLCGGNDYRDIVTGIDMSTVQSITWQRFISGGSCITVSNSDCANESASPSCWVQIATGADYRANTAGQFRVIIVDSLGTPFIHYFNVFQNSLIPTAVSKSDIVTYGTGSCQINGRIAVGGFGSGYEYSFTTGTAPGAWQDSNVFTTSVPGNYTAFIRIKGVVGSCVFKVINQIINRTEFVASTSIVSPKCNGALGSIQVSVTDVNQQYKYQLFNSSNVLVSTFGPTNDITYTFTGLNAGSYRVVTTVEGVPCMSDTKTNVTVANPPAILTSGATITTALTSCNTGRITITRSGGTGPYKFFVNIDGAGFVENTTNIIIVEKSGSYVIRVIDVNGCSATDKTVVVPVVDRPLYSISKTDGNCTGTLGQISVNVSNTNGYYLEYSFNNGSNYSTTNTVSGLLPGQYNVIVRYRKAGVNSGNFCSDPVDVITIGASTALTASAGVAELSGCGPTGNESQGRVRITNPQGGTPFPAPNLYRYSFDNKVTWITSNEAFINPGGPYTFYIRDASGCEYAMGGVILDPKPDAPTISVDTPVFNCDGSATSTVTVTNSGSTPKFSYDYYMDGTLNTVAPTNVFTNVTQGDHTITVNYNVLSVPTYSVLLQEDFGKGGFTTTPGINPAYCFEDESTPHPPGWSCGNINDYTINDGKYAVASKIKTTFGVWLVANDHTLPDDPLGRFLCVNVGGSAGIGGILYSKPIRDVIPNQPVIISLWAQNLIRSTSPTLADPKLTIQLVNNLNGVGGTETIVATSDPTPGNTNPWVVPKSNQWEFRDLSLNPGAFNNLSFVIRSYSNEFNGNDVLIDDILVRQIPKSCNTVASFPIVVDGSKAFSASIIGFKDVRCSGQTNGEITLSARNFDPVKGFQYQVDGGSWITVIPSPAATTGSVTLTNLAGKIYNINIRYDNSASSCTFALAQEIKIPSTVTAAAAILTPATCTTGATIRATGGGGTPAYQYELRAANGTTVITAFNNNRDFTNVPAGDYTVFVTDANGCTNPTGVAIQVLAAPAVTATLATTTDYCYTTANPATLVINVTGGTGPFTYQLDSNGSDSSAATTYSYANVTPGTHTILVTDSNNCTATISNIVIAPQIAFNVSLINDLTCLVDASIGNPVITNGYGAPYTYTVSRDSGTPTAVTSFPYTATQSGSYVFTVTDSRGCPATSNPIVVTPKTTPALTFGKTNVTCIGLSDGTITITPSGGFTTTYTYAIKLSTVTTYTTQATNQFIGLAAGTYNIKVIDSKGCESAVTNVIIANPTVITASLGATDIKCSTTGTVPAVVTVTASGGTGTLQYSFNGTTNFTTSNTFSTATAGPVTAYVKDANNCQIGPLSIAIDAIDQITDITITDSGYDCSTTPAGGNINIAAVKTDVSAPIRYQIISGPAGFSTATNSSGTFQGLAPGNYVFQALDIKTDCFFRKSYTVNGAPDIVAGGSVLTPISCFGGTGTIQFTVSGVKDRGYNYIIRNAANATIQNANNVSETITTINVPTAQPAGVYTITVTDRKTLCSDDYSVTLTQPTALTITSATPTTVNCNNDNAQITVTATGGTTNYSYAFATNPSTVPTSPYGTNPVLTVDTNSATQMSWDVYVKDANGCTQKTTVAITSDATPIVTAALTGQCTSTTGSFTITATGSSGTGALTYGINGITGAFQGSAVFTVVPRATPYTVWVKDANGCTSSATPITVYPQLTVNGSVTKTLDCNTAGPNATITATITGGKANYSYVITNGVGTTVATGSGVTGPTITYTGAAADTYTVTVTDANTPSCNASTTIKVDPITPPTVAVATQVNVSCTGGNDGSVTLIGSGGSGGYTYSNNATSGFTSNPTFTILAAGTYTFYVRDNKGCQNSVPVTITQPANALAATADVVPFSCSLTNANVSGTVTINVTAGTGTSPYTYSFNGGAFTSNNVLTLNDNGSNQPYTYAVQDNKGCQISGSGSLSPLNKPVIGSITSTRIFCAPATTTSTVTIPVTAGTGVGTLTYTILAPASATGNTTGATNGIFTGLPSGNYTFRVTDANGCYDTESHFVAPVTPIAIAPNKISDVLCQGGSTGSGTYTVSGNATIGAYTFTLTAGSLGTTGTLTQSGNVLTLSNVAAGTYTVRVRDNETGCEADGTITINQPAAPLAITNTVATNFNCNNDNAQITITATGGTTTYGYAAVPATPVTVPTTFASSAVVTVDTNNGTILNWVVFVRDANGCTTSRSVTIAGDPAPAPPVVTVPNQCSATGSGFTITVTPVTGPLGPYTYGISGITGAFQVADTFNVAPGSYTVFVRDRNGCFSTGTAVTVAAQLTANAGVTKTLDCTPTPNATISTTINGGRANYNYTITNSSSVVVDSGTGITGPTFTYSPTVAGTYTIAITDANGCTTTASATVAPIADPSLAIATQVNVSCNGGSNGSVTLIGSGGSGGYLYSNNASTGFTSNPTFPNLAAGTYTFYVRDSKLCDTSINVTITEPANALAATVTEVPFSCSLSNAKVSGTVTINVTAGTGTSPYTYSFNGGAFTSINVLTLNDNGSVQPYTYAVQDNKGCQISGSGSLSPLNKPVIGIITSTRIFCAPAATTSTVTIPVTAGTGVGTLTYTILAPASATGNTTGATNGIFTGLPSGNYTFRVTGANGCYDTESHFVAPVTPIVATATKLTDVDCNGNTTGSIRYTVSGFGTGSYSYTINGVATATGQTAGTFDLTNRAAGTYAVVFTDDVTSCTASTSVTITQPAQALAATYTTVNANCNVPTASVTVTPTGGTANYRYSFVTSSTIPGAYGTNNIANLNPTTSTTWYVHIIDANNCTSVLTLNIASDPIPTVTATATGQCLGSGSYTITALGSGGVGTLSYSINGGASYQAGNTFTVTTSGNYTITVKDTNNCTSTSNVIAVAPQLTLNAFLNKDITCVVGDEPARITMTPTGGSGSFTYAITTPASEATNVTGAITGIFTTSVPGNYTFTVTDTTTGCTYTTTAAIPVTTAILPDITSITQTAFINCNGDDTGAIRANFNASLGLAPFEFSNNGGPFQSSNTFTGLSQGTYTITIRDAKGCTDFQNITITEPGLIDFDLTRIPIQCISGVNTLGSITVASVSGGTGSFRYFITNNFGSVVTPNPYVATSNEDFTFTIIDFGIYTVTVVDANGCSLSKQITMTSPPTSLNIAVNVTTPDCISGGTATVTVGAPVLGNSYDFGIVNSNIPPYTSTFNPANNGPYSYNFTGLTPGVTYSFVVRDNVTGCLFVNTAGTPINPASTITAALTPNNVTCVGANDGSVTMTVSGFTNTATSIDYQIFRQQSNSTVGGVINQPVSGGTPFTVTYPAPGSLPAGQYYIVYIENGGVNNGCKASFPFEIKESSVNLSVIATVISNENCNQGGVISAQARDGAGSYEYLINTTNALPTALTAGWQTGNTFSNLVANTYYVFAKDAFGCIQPAIARVLIRDLEPTIALPAPICYNGTPFTIDLVTNASASATILPATYKVEPIASLGTAAYQNGSVFTFNAAGTYRLYIKDGNGCVDFEDYTVLPQLQLQPELTKVLDCNLPTPNATVTVTASGGTATYAYTIVSGPVVNTTGATSGIFTGLDAGNYIFEVNDGACTATTTFRIDPIPATIIATPIVTNVSCNGGSDGRITINVTSGVGPYEYSLFDGVTATAFTTNNTFTGLGAGTAYVVTVRNDRDCLQASPSITITEPAPLTATASAAANTTCSTTTLITVDTVTGGTSSGVGTGYTYSFNGLSFTGDNTFTVNNGPLAATTTIVVRDANNCTFTLPIVVTPALTPPTNLTFAVTTAPTCPANTATVQVTATGGLGSLDFDIIEFNNVPTTLYPTQSTAGSGTPTSFANLPPGDYIFRVTDDNGCTYQELYTVVPVTPIAIVGALVNDITCNPANGTTNNGSARFTVTGVAATSTYSYTINSGTPVVGQTSPTIDLTSLGAGTYTVSVTDETTLCVATDDVTITLPNPITFAPTASNVFCTKYNSEITVGPVTGGTGLYTYAAVRNGDPAPTTYINTPILTVDTVNGTVLTWDVYVRDVNLCVGIVPVTILSDPAPSIGAPAAQCYTGTPIVINLASLVTVTVGPAQFYTVNGANQTNATYTITAPGTYNFSVTDANGCISNTETYTIVNQLIAGALLDKDLTCAPTPAATINVTITGGVGPFSYQMFNGVTAVGGITPVTGTTFTVNPTTAGTYSFVITDSYSPTCSVTTNPVGVTTPVTPTFTAVATDATCNLDSNGTITVTPTAGVAPFTFALSGTGFNTTGDGTGNYSGLRAGSYTVTITDAKGCPATSSTPIVINEPLVVSATIDVTIPLSCGTGNVTQAATVTAVPSGGNGSYQFNFNNQGWTTDNFYVTSIAGPVSVLVRDTNLCTVLASANTTVIALDPPTDLAFLVTTAPTCPADSATVQVTATGGLGSLDFDIIEFNNVPTTLYPTQSTAGSGTPTSFANLPPGDYIFRVTDDNGCTYQELYTVLSVTPIAIVGALVNDITCNPANGTTNNGSARFTVTGFSSTGNYSINVTSVPALLPFTQLPLVGDVITLTGLNAGTYTVTVTDNTTLCAASDAVTITLPAAINFTTAATKVFCTQDISQITVSAVTGGSGVYQYAVLPGGTVTPPAMGAYNTNPVLSVDTNLTALSWDVYVMDTKGCVGMQNVTVVNNAAPTIVAPAAQCYTGTPLTVDLSQIIPIPITTTYNGTKFYTLNGTLLASSIATFNGPGTYVLGIRDDNGCEAFVNYIILPQLTLQADMTQDLTCPAPASITLVPAGGATPYTTFEVNINNGGYNVIAGSPYTTSTAGTYKFRVTDSQGCQAESQDVIVTPNTTPTATAAFTNVSCIGATDGTITLTPSGGNVPYEYSLNGGTYQSSNVFSGLGVGPYSIVVRDAKLCVSTPILVTIGNPAALTATATVTPFGCDTANAPIDAVVTIIPTGGTGVYSYSINGGFAYQNSPSFTVNTAQTINYIVKDANGCTFPGSANVLPYTPPTDMDLVATPIYCNTPGAVATVTVNTVTGGVGPFVFEIILPTTAATAPSAPSSTPFSFTNLAPDTYTIRVTDANGCSTTKAILVEEADKIAVTAQLINNVYCNTDSTGIIEFTVTDYITPANYSFNLSPNLGAMTQVGDVIRYTGVPAGAYTFTVTDNTSGCVASISNFAVTEPALALDFNSSATNTNCTSDEATITVTASGGTLNYKYAVALATAGAPATTAYSLSNTLLVDTNNGTDVNWIVYVMDANDCAINKPLTILADVNPSNITVATYSECPDTLTGTYTFTINPPTGVAPFTYSIGGGFQTSPTFVVNAPGSYNVTVKDANGCPTTVPALVVIRQPLILTPVVSIPVSCTGGDGQITVSTTGGSANYVYNIDGGPFAAVTGFNLVAAGNHIIGVRDTTTLCEAFVPVNLQAATDITGFALAKTDVTCNGGSDGTIRATIATPAPGVNDNPVYLYSLNLGLPQASNVFSNLAAGPYTVRVISSRGCDATETITVGEPGLITVPAPTILQFGCTSGNIDNLATITVTGVGGGSLTYLNYEFIKVGTPNTIVQFSTSNVYQESNLAGGDYIVNVYDDKGCVGTNTARINPFIGIDFASPSGVTVTRAITCVNNEDIQVNATFTGGSPVILDYTIVATPSNVIPYVSVTNNTGQFTDLTVGSYTITVVNPATGCVIRTIHIVNEPNTFDLVASNIQNVVCFGTTTGSVDLTFVDNQLNPSDDAGAFEYTITDPTGTTSPVLTSTSANITIPNLLVGFYTVSARLLALPSCDVETSFTIEGPVTDLTLSVSQTPITCDPGNDGSITATGDGGWPGSYQYELVGVTPGSVSVPLSYQFKFENLTPGTYNVNVLDTGGCTETVTVTLSNPTPIIFTAAATAPILACNGDNNGEIVVNAPTGGQGSNYSYILNYVSANPVFSSAPQTTPVFSGLVAGNYTVTVIDGLGCISVPSATITINEPTKVEPLLVLTSGITCINDATVTLSATGGSGPYDYSTDANFVSTLGSFVSSITFSVGLGDHQYYVRDANNCVSNLSNNVAIVALDPLELSKKDVTVVLCRGSNTGSIDVQAVGGLGNYMYTLLDSTNNVIRPAQSSGFFEFLSVGNYVVRVDSGDCVLNSEVFNITEPPTALTIDSVVQTDVTCAGERNGSLTITTSGGTGKISFTITPNPDQTFDADANGDIVFDNLRPGVYDFTVQDQNGCFNPSRRVIIGEPGSVFANVIANSAIPEVCAGDADGAFSLNITGGVAPYSVSLNNRNGTYTTGTLTQTQFDFSGLSGNEQIVYIRDANGCESDISIMLGEPVTLNPVADVNYDCVNNSQVNSVTITVAAGNVPADLDYSLDGSLVFQTSNVFNNLSAGRHTVDVRHTNGCIKQVIFNVDQINPITIALSDGGLNEIVSTVSGGFGNYQYSLNGEPQGSQGNFIIYKSGDYTVTVTDANGCSATATRYFEFIDIKIPNVFTPNGDGNNDTWAPTNTINYKDLIFEVFDRYGRKIGTYREGQSWNGKYNGNELPSGDYWYILRLRNVQDAREFVGHFTLYR